MKTEPFSDWLREELKKRGWLAAHLSRESGISRGALSHIFSHERYPGLDMLKAISRALGLPLMDVMKAAGVFDPSENPADESLEEWVKVFRDADNETRKKLLMEARKQLNEPK